MADTHGGKSQAKRPTEIAPESAKAAGGKPSKKLPVTPNSEKSSSSGKRTPSGDKHPPTSGPGRRTSATTPSGDKGTVGSGKKTPTTDKPPSTRRTPASTPTGQKAPPGGRRTPATTPSGETPTKRVTVRKAGSIEALHSGKRAGSIEGLNHQAAKRLGSTETIHKNMGTCASTKAAGGSPRITPANSVNALAPQKAPAKEKPVPEKKEVLKDALTTDEQSKLEIQAEGVSLSSESVASDREEELEKLEIIEDSDRCPPPTENSGETSMQTDNTFDTSIPKVETTSGKNDPEATPENVSEKPKEQNTLPTEKCENTAAAETVTKINDTIYLDSQNDIENKEKDSDFREVPLDNESEEGVTSEDQQRTESVEAEENCSKDTGDGETVEIKTSENTKVLTIADACSVEAHGVDKNNTERSDQPDSTIKPSETNLIVTENQDSTREQIDQAGDSSENRSKVAEEELIRSLKQLEDLTVQAANMAAALGQNVEEEKEGTKNEMTENNNPDILTKSEEPNAEGNVNLVPETTATEPPEPNCEDTKDLRTSETKSENPNAEENANLAAETAATGTPESNCEDTKAKETSEAKLEEPNSGETLVPETTTAETPKPDCVETNVLKPIETKSEEPNLVPETTTTETSEPDCEEIKVLETNEATIATDKTDATIAPARREEKDMLSMEESELKVDSDATLRVECVPGGRKQDEIQLFDPALELIQKQATETQAPQLVRQEAIDSDSTPASPLPVLKETSATLETLNSKLIDETLSSKLVDVSEHSEAAILETNTEEAISGEQQSEPSTQLERSTEGNPSTPIVSNDSEDKEGNITMSVAPEDDKIAPEPVHGENAMTEGKTNDKTEDVIRVIDKVPTTIESESQGDTPTVAETVERHTSQEVQSSYPQTEDGDISETHPTKNVQQQPTDSEGGESTEENDPERGTQCTETRPVIPINGLGPSTQTEDKAPPKELESPVIVVEEQITKSETAQVECVVPSQEHDEIEPISSLQVYNRLLAVQREMSTMQIQLTKLQSAMRNTSHALMDVIELTEKQLGIN